ncbi:ABC transporter ATP-binding protein [Desulfoscipio sp. XC116]|uniref:ABC transporter ATP-binding protein n=1 Tax=Desulfoscipio sp. XC116 TaxID=3144975 RepID=UPI00325AB497
MVPLLELRGISKNYASHGVFRGGTDSQDVLRNVSFQINEGESLGLIGESGCGKTTLAKIAAGLEAPTKGQVLYSGEDIREFDFATMQKARKNVQIIFQNSKSIFNPYYTIGNSIKHALENFERLTGNEIKMRVNYMLERVGLDSSFADRYPEKLSGGQRQRANIARALIARPKLIICDEPVASLDFSIRKKTLDMLNDMIRDMSLTCIFISHDISTVRYSCKKVGVMYRGTLVEIFPLESGLTPRPKHPYSQMLMDSVPILHPSQRSVRKHIKTEELNQAKRYENGCVFYSLCGSRRQICSDVIPDLKDMGNGHYVACCSCDKTSALIAKCN